MTTQSLVTPEGVPLRIQIAGPAERAAAFLIDLIIIDIIVFCMLLVAGLFDGAAFVEFTWPAVLFLAFMLRNGYFICCEMLFAGSTPGKRLTGLRVVDRGGGGLTPLAVVARNLSREVETFLPLALLLTGPSGDAGPWLGAAWLALASFFPACNRDRLRVGDYLGGTMVIVIPKRTLVEDLAADRSAYQFSSAQLRRYGIHELHVLEQVLRMPDTVRTTDLQNEIAEKIRQRIEWVEPIKRHEARSFLRDFYAAQRNFLEIRKHLGEVRADKYFEED